MFATRPKTNVKFGLAFTFYTATKQILQMLMK